MKVGAAYPSNEIGSDPDVIRRFVAGVETLGLQYIMIPDHVLKAPLDGRDPPLVGPYTEKDAFSDPFALMGFMSAITDRLEFATGVLVLPQRQTAVVAQQAADVDLMSRGRLRLGIGLGWNHVEYTGLGQDFRRRAKRMEEQIRLLRLLWSEPVISFDGQFDRIDRAGINPRPRRPIPLWLGGNSAPAYERGAKLGEGFIFAGTTETVREALAQVRLHLDRFGREHASFGLDLLTQFARSPQLAAEQLQFWSDAGGSHATVSTSGKGLGDDLGAHLGFLEAVLRGSER